MQSVKVTELPDNPREKASWLSQCVFWYTFPTFIKGRKKLLDEKDLYKTLSSHKSEMLGNKMCQSWEKELLNSDSKKKPPSLLRALLRVFGGHIALLGFILMLLELGIRCMQPMFLLGLIGYFDPLEENTSKHQAWLYGGGVVLFSALSVAITHPYMLSTMHIGMKMRVALCSMLYRKTLRLSKAAMGETTAGQIVNLLSNDVARLDLCMVFLHYLWVGPLETAFITYLMSREIGMSAIFGVAFMMLFIPLQGWLGKKTSVLRLRTALRTDERVRMMNEIISGIQVIKMYAWEIPFSKMVEYARRKEINCIRKVSYIRGILLSFIMFLTRVSIFFSLVGYVLLERSLSPQQAFVITAYYNILRTTMTVFFPQGISAFAEVLVSLKRIQNFMLFEETAVETQPDLIENQDMNDADSNQATLTKADEDQMDLQQETKPLTGNVGHATLSEAGISLTNVKAKWDKNATEYNLDDVNLRVQPGTLVAIIGPVGSGKSSLMQSILGELQPESGTVKVNGSVSYASQEPWLFTGTVRQNILFGQPMNKYRYRTVVKKCALQRDFELLPYGDKTIVGERGASLSGGQKARISLARAVYRQASIYLLDDPLSAVDTHVGRHLFDQCMRDYLRDNIVILVTHQLQFLQHADHIVIMSKGRVIAVGSYESLRETGLDFAKLLAESERSDESEEKMRSTSSSASLYNRHNSVSSLASVAESMVEDTPSPMQQQEAQEIGHIGLGLYKKYFKAGGGLIVFMVMMFSFLLAQALASGGDYFLSYWVNKKQNEKLLNDAELKRSAMNNTFSENDWETTTIMSTTMSALVTIDTKFREYLQGFGINVDGESLDMYIFTVLVISTIIVSLARSFIFFNVAMRASQYLHNKMFSGITRAAMYFFNTNSSGRILNRFSKDMGQVDEILPSTMIDVIQIFLQLFGIVGVIAIVNPILIVPTLILAIIFYYLRSFYLKTSRNVKRVEAITRSPIYSHMAASLSGLATIRSFGAQHILIKEFDNHQDLNSSAFYIFISTSRAFGYWLDIFCVIFIAIVTLNFFVFTPDNGGSVGLAITQAIGMTGMVQWGMRQSAELENTMTAVERVVEYENIEAEGELESTPEKKPPKEWPQDGNILFEELSLRYFPDPKSDYVLKSLNISIQSQEKIGIVGRTGAGKSSLINALFRLSYNDGSVIIDKRDTKDMGLHDLRSKISIIPQEPVLFSGTMRYNLDPFDEYSDAKLWDALEEVKLKEVVSELPNGLQSKISEGGSNFSVGQRQLVCLARAILRENKILVMDEATANVDPQTDALIQTTIRHKFQYCTVLTIAHRLNTVMDSDKVLVMDAGRAVEFGAPYELLTESNTKIFQGMVEQTGKATYSALLKVAQKAYEERVMRKKNE